MRISYNYCELISCLRVHMPTIFIDCTLSNGWALRLARTTVVGSGRFGGSFWVGEDFKVLIWSVIDVMDYAIFSLNYSVRSIIFSSKSCLLDFISFLLDSIVAYMKMIFHLTCYKSCWFLLEFWILRYEEHYLKNISMVIIWCYMAQMRVNKWINWWDKCVHHASRVEEVWDIGG